MTQHIDLQASTLCPGSAGGTVGMIVTSLFATTSANAAGVDGAFYGNGLLLGKTLAVLVVLVPWICAFTWGCLWVTDKVLSLRVSGGHQEEIACIDRLLIIVHDCVVID